MPTQATIQRIAKLLARATSPEAGEAQSALEGAYKRMKRDGVSFDDLLTLPKDDLYQDIMVKLIDLILADQPNLSHASRREAYGQYMLLIVAKFSGRWDGQRSGQGNGSGAQDEEREAAAREYERRRKAEEEGRAQAQGRSGQQSRQSERQQGQSTGDKGFKSANPQTPKQETAWTWRWQGKEFSFSPAVFIGAMQPVWGRGSILWHTLHDPARGFRLFAASLLWGMGFAAVLIAIAAFGHAVTDTMPVWDVPLKHLFASLAAVGTLWKAWTFWQAGWFR